MAEIYLGRIVGVGMTAAGQPACLYRVSSRSFPNRMAQAMDNGRRVAITPKPGFEKDVLKNPYIAYNCARLVGNTAVLTNGTHTDPITEKIAQGMSIRDALTLSLLAMDYEKDDYNTPRIAAVADAETKTGWLGTVRTDGLEVRSFPLEPGRVLHISTYEHQSPGKQYESSFSATTAENACSFLINGPGFSDFTNAVTAVAAVWEHNAFQLKVLDLG